MAIKSTFASGARLIAAYFLFLTVMLLIFLVLTFIDLNPSSIAMILPISLFGFAWIVLVRGELKTKAIKVAIDDKKITVSKYLGLGPAKTYDLADFEGYITTVIPSKKGPYEFLYLMSDKKPVIKLSQFYHANYDQLKFFLDGIVPFLGEEEFKKPTSFRELMRS